MPRAATKTRRKTPIVRAEAKRPVARATGYAVGNKVSHPKFGDGTVTAVDADKLTIKFRGGRVRLIVDYYVRRRDR